MKKILINTLLVLFLPMISYSQFSHLGLSAAYSSEVKKPGFGIYGIFRVNDDIKLTPGIIYYLPHTIDTDLGTQKFQWWAINLDGNYVIARSGMFEGYGIMGLNFSNITGEQDEEELGQTFQDKQSMLKLGLNAGAGIRLNLGDKFVPFGELRYTLGSKADFTFNEVSTSQFSIFAGFLIRIAEDKDRSKTEDY
ncbi:MAG: outer membrane beta-barrel protein [Bacteroidales bacterium]|nr:outer membrane beta-barrel protein [Bacteroidales bacterium]